jgi:hypothetical protein
MSRENVKRSSITTEELGLFKTGGGDLYHQRTLLLGANTKSAWHIPATLNRGIIRPHKTNKNTGGMWLGNQFEQAPYC